ncbi:molybdopterin biosynthesis protein MoeA [Corynebacterium phocae]|uniref:Molybdopterin molybdenumtransferase n=1 Tax=Corynebacterium phocae TaxID=161895 RepID=A0A1L7D0L7_9CORY|nr:molybdopterin molybdotransferase MoeA [Corynebacterium phocae]APT91696.1 molybdopterin biosynthesis protein MoeA [Corynebacterium phocae]KAA8728604.1 molybdopterin molybdotransferase MoeA [Corynebacterium phocae]
MRTYEQHLHAVRAQVDKPQVVTRPLAEAGGLVAASTLTAQFDLPRFDNSQMDGYALDSTAGGVFRVGQTLAAGTEPKPLHEGVATPIMTGAKVPAGTVTIVPVERCHPPHFGAEGQEIQVPAAPQGQFIRRRGEDMAAGQVIVAEGTRLNPAAIGTLAAQGVTEVAVYAPARLLLCTGGAEIGQGAAKIPDSNAPLLMAAAKQYGLEVAGHVRTNDDPEALRADLEHAVRRHRPDAIVTSGGISQGKFEVIRQLLTDGWFGHVAQQPGGPQGLAQFIGVPVLCLPGNPLSTLVSFRLYVAPVLGVARPPQMARLTAGVPGIPGRDQFRRGQLTHTARATADAEVLPGAGSHLLAHALEATALIRIPAGATLQAGDRVEVFPC